MKIKYLSHQQAAAIKSEYQHLIGQPFGGEVSDSSRTVNAIVVGPYSRILQWSFARHIVKGMHPAEALRQWPIDRFDVIVISQNPRDPADYQIMDLRTYLAERGIEFVGARYSKRAA